jgi:hypothetical protein
MGSRGRSVGEYRSQARHSTKPSGSGGTLQLLEREDTFMTDAAYLESIGDLATRLRGLRRFLSKSAGDKTLSKAASSAFDEHRGLVDKILDGVQALKRYKEVEPELLRQHRIMCEINTGTLH